MLTITISVNNKLITFILWGLDCCSNLLIASKCAQTVKVHFRPLNCAYRVKTFYSKE